MKQIWTSEIQQEDMGLIRRFYKDEDEAMQAACEVKWDEYEELKKRANHSFSHSIIAFIGEKVKVIGKNLASCFDFEPESYEASWLIDEDGNLSSKQEGLRDVTITYRVLEKEDAAKEIKTRDDFMRKTKPIGQVAAELLL